MIGAEDILAYEAGFVMVIVMMMLMFSGVRM